MEARCTLGHPIFAFLAADAPELEQYLVLAIKAEYTTFSTVRPGLDLPRPSAYQLRRYFNVLNARYSKAPLAK